MKTATVQRTQVVLHADRTRVLLRPFLLAHDSPGIVPGAAGERAFRICASVMALPESEVQTLWNQVQAEFGDRHAKTREFLKRRFEQVRPYLPAAGTISEPRELLLGAFRWIWV